MEKVREVGINNKNIQDIIEKEIATTNNNSEAEDIKVEVRKFLSKNYARNTTSTVEIFKGLLKKKLAGLREYSLRLRMRLWIMSSISVLVWV